MESFLSLESKSPTNPAQELFFAMMFASLNFKKYSRNTDF